jgi:hypothetical protein
MAPRCWAMRLRNAPALLTSETPWHQSNSLGMTSPHPDGWSCWPRSFSSPEGSAVADRDNASPPALVPGVRNAGAGWLPRRTVPDDAKGSGRGYPLPVTAVGLGQNPGQARTVNRPDRYGRTPELRPRNRAGRLQPASDARLTLIRRRRSDVPGPVVDQRQRFRRRGGVLLATVRHGTGQHLGDLPQAFTHLALVDALTRLIEMEATESKEGSASVTA